MADLVNLDKWLEELEGKYACYTSETVISFPTNHVKAYEALGLLLSTVEGLFGGATLNYGWGSWCESQDVFDAVTGKLVTDPSEIARLDADSRTIRKCSKVVREPVAIINVSHKPCLNHYELEQLVEALRNAGRLTDQTALGLKNGNKFYVVPPNIMEVKRVNMGLAAGGNEQ